jgi:excisionase family DNA binding protein
MAGKTNIGCVTPPPLVRPSALARFWGIHTKTLHGWIQQGRLAALRSPGNHVRLRIADVRAFCEREGLPVPPFVAPAARRIVLAGATEAAARAVARSLKGAAVTLSTYASPYDGLVSAVATPTQLLALGVAHPRFDPEAAVRALKASPAGAGVAVVALGVRTRSAAASLLAAGALRALGRDAERELPAVTREVLALRPARAQ